MAQEDKSSKRLLIGSLVFIVVILLLMLAFSWLLTKGIDDEPYNTPEKTNVQQQFSDNAPSEPSSSNITGGSDGVGTGQSNDTSVETPSPAGGVDTNGDPANQ